MGDFLMRKSLLILLLTTSLFGQWKVDWTTDPPTVTLTGSFIATAGHGVHGEMYFNTNTNTQTPVADDVIGIINMTQGSLDGFTFEAGEIGTFSGTSDNGGDVTITTGAHTVDVGDWVVISQTTTNGTYDITGVFLVTADGGTTFDITFADWDASETGVWQSPSQLSLTESNMTSVEFDIKWDVSASVAGSPAGDIVDWGIYINDSQQINTFARRTLTTGSEWGAFGGGGFVTLTTGDEVYMFFKSDDVNALTHRYGHFTITQH